MLNRSLTRLFFLLTFLHGASCFASDCVAKVVAGLGRAAPADVDVIVKFASSLEDSASAGEGLIAALSARQSIGDQAARVREVLFYFPAGEGRAVFEQLQKVAHVGEQGGLGDLVVNLGKSQSDAIGSAATLRYATTKMDPSKVARFEVTVPGGRVDMVDDAGDFFEFKSLDLSIYGDFVARIELGKIKNQSLLFQQAAAEGGKVLTLAFERSVPPAYQALFDEVLGPLIALPNVRFVNGF